MKEWDAVLNPCRSGGLNQRSRRGPVRSTTNFLISVHDPSGQYGTKLHAIDPGFLANFPAGRTVLCDMFPIWSKYQHCNLSAKSALCRY